MTRTRSLGFACIAALWIAAACGASGSPGQRGTSVPVAAGNPAIPTVGPSRDPSGSGPSGGGPGSPATLMVSPAPGLEPPASPGILVTAWAAVPVEQPPALIQPYPSGNAPVFCSPCHSADQTDIAAVARGRDRLVAVGSSLPGPRAAAWVSADGAAWRRTALAGPPGSLLVAVVATANGYVAVGGTGRAAAAWTSRDGSTWTPASVAGPAPAASERMTTVIAWGPGEMAAGYTEGPEGIEPVIWTSSGGSTWARTPLPGSGEVLGLAAAGNTIVAVGANGLNGAAGRLALAWRSADGVAWRVASVEGADAAAMRGVLAMERTDGPAGVDGAPAFVAVGSGASGDMAAVWTSGDGRSWSLHPGGSEMTNYGQRIAMASLAQGRAGFVAVGGRDAAGNGSPVVWTSNDGLSWSRVPDAPSFSGGEMTGIVAGATGWIAVGSLGWPDNWVATAWVGQAVP